MAGVRPQTPAARKQPSARRDVERMGALVRTRIGDVVGWLGVAALRRMGAGRHVAVDFELGA